MAVIPDGNSLTLEDLCAAVFDRREATVRREAYGGIEASRRLIERIALSDEVVYGVNTGFGKMASARISPEEICELQLNLVRSHACGVGTRLLFRVAERLLRNPEEAEEVLQVVFLTIFRMAAKFDPQRGGVKIWLLQYAYSQSLRRKHQLSSRYFYTTEDIESVLSELSQRGSTGPSGLSSQEASRLVHQALELIDEKQKRTIEMTHYEGLAAIEIAERTGWYL